MNAHGAFDIIRKGARFRGQSESGGERLSCECVEKLREAYRSVLVSYARDPREIPKAQRQRKDLLAMAPGIAAMIAADIAGCTQGFSLL